MHDDDGTRAWCDAARQLRGIEVIRLRANVGENRLRSRRAYGAAGGNKSGRRQKHFVAGLHTACAQGENQGIRSGSDSHAMRNTTECGNFFLESCALAPEHKLL